VLSIEYVIVVGDDDVGVTASDVTDCDKLNLYAYVVDANVVVNTPPALNDSDDTVASADFNANVYVNTVTPSAAVTTTLTTVVPNVNDVMADDVEPDVTVAPFTVMVAPFDVRDVGVTVTDVVADDGRLHTYASVDSENVVADEPTERVPVDNAIDDNDASDDSSANV
jgi:hypothetical protein